MRFLLFFLALGSLAFAQVATPAPGKFPPLRVQVTVGTQERAAGTDFYHKTMHVLPKCLVEGASTMVPLPAAEAQMLIVTMDTHAKFVEHREALKVHSTETLPVPAAPDGNRRQFSFADFMLTFDAYRDTTNVGGELYRYYVFALRDATTKEIVDFQTNCLPLANFVKAHPEKRIEVLGLGKNAKFPNEFK